MNIKILISVPEVFDPDSDEATSILRNLESKLNELEYDWHVEDLIGEEHE